MKKSLLLKNYIQELSNLTVTLEIERKQKDIIKSNRKRFKSKLYKLNQSIDFISNCSSVQDAVSYLIKERDEITESIDSITELHINLTKRVQSTDRKRNHLKSEIAFEEIKHANEKKSAS
tara:strand:- start:112 stop:471 length:360 start_codon:yes stop_codon:yes gene_type:complete